MQLKVGSEKPAEPFAGRAMGCGTERFREGMSKNKRRRRDHGSTEIACSRVRGGQDLRDGDHSILNP